MKKTETIEIAAGQGCTSHPKKETKQRKKSDSGRTEKEEENVRSYAMLRTNRDFLGLRTLGSGGG
jgi:hypothetical protein